MERTVVGATMPLEERTVDAYQCPSCGALRAIAREACCGRPLEPVDTSVAIEPPEVSDIARAVFDISSTELAICRTLMAEDEATIRDLAERLPRDRSVIQRHVSHLVELGVLEKRSRSLPAGGRVNVYAPKSPEEIRRRLHLGLYAWMTDAEDRVEELNREKMEAMVESADVAPVDDEPAATSAEATLENGGSRRPGPADDNDTPLVARLLERFRSR